MNKNSMVAMVLLVLFVLQVGIKYVPDLIPGPTTNAIDKITWVHDVRVHGAAPPGVAKFLMDTNAQGILAEEYEIGQVGPTGQVPEKNAVAAKAYADSNEARGPPDRPCLVAESNSRVVKVIRTEKNTTAEQSAEVLKK